MTASCAKSDFDGRTAHGKMKPDGRKTGLPDAAGKAGVKKRKGAPQRGAPLTKSGTNLRSNSSNKQLLQHGMVTNSEFSADTQKAGGNGNEAGKSYYLL